MGYIILATCYSKVSTQVQFLVRGVDMVQKVKLKILFYIYAYIYKESLFCMDPKSQEERGGGDLAS